ncbi:cytochrome c3 family protein [Geobacter sp. AOG1]|uniref:cytochrome c3 family protein n=1 Tax=Geobacter sp. AOG1 TaxID=1566346 RepID=UPI001EE5B9FC|nr:cytochrome c3 family protein [Geobacter sp. AOG1]
MTVTNPDTGSGTGTGVFTVNAAPTVTSTTPNSRTQGQTNQNITITGTGFSNTPTAPTVVFSGTGITVNSVTYTSATSLTANIDVAPDATTGARNVTVTNARGSAGTGTGVFTVNAAPAPTVTATSPNNAGQGTNNLNVTITGTNFLSGASAAFSGTGITVNSTSYVSATQLTANITITAGAATGLRSVTVTLPGGQTGTGNNVFTVNAGTCTANAPTVTLSADAGVQKGQQTSYALSVTNNDNSFCGSTPFTIAVGTETGNTASFVLPSVLGSTTTGALAPGATYNTTLTVKAQAAAVVGNTLTSQVNVSGAGHTTQSDSAITTIVSSWTQNDLLHNSTNATNISKSTPYWNANGGWGLPGTKYGAFDCTTCHIPGSTNISRIKVTLTAPDATAFPGSAVLFQSKTTVNDGTNPSFGVYSAAITNSTKICEVCHSQTWYHKQSMTAIVGHENQAKQVDCIACHKHNQGFKAIGGCTICHKFVQRSDRSAVMSQFSSGNSHHIQGAGVTDQQCYQCHWEANIDGTVNVNYHGGSLKTGSTVDLVVYQSGARPVARSTTTFVPYSATGTRHDIQKLNTVCIGCHSAASATAVPFGDGNTPQKYAWDGKSIDERYSQTGGVKWGKYSSSGTNAHNVNAKDTVVKAFSAHGNTSFNKRGWSTTNGIDSSLTDTSGAVNVLCYDCHNSHGSTVKGITSNYSSATGRNHGAILKDTDNGIGGYTANYQPSSDSTTANAKYNPGAGLCFDCHLNSTAGATVPWGYQGTFGATQRIIGYWDSPYFKTPTVAGDYFGPAQRYAYKATIVANKGGHFGASSTLDNPPDAQHQINGLCTPCHDPHGVSPTLNQKYSVPLLKGTWMTSPYKEDVTPVATNESRGGTNHGGSNTQRPNKQNVSSTPRYYIDQNTFGGSTTVNQVNFGTAQTAREWNLADTTNRVTETDTQFGGLCLDCHSKTLLAPKAGQNVAPDAWKSRSRIHGTVKGWATTSTAADGNANNKVHSYTCSKCHAPHNYRLPRLMAVNCLNFEHRGQKGTTGIIGVTTVAGVASSTGYANPTDDGFHEVTTGQCGKGRGRFPVGGGYYSPTTSPRQSAQNPGTWWFGNTATGAFNSCHDNANTIDTTYPMKQRWNSKTPW